MTTSVITPVLEHLVVMDDDDAIRLLFERAQTMIGASRLSSFKRPGQLIGELEALRDLNANWDCSGTVYVIDRTQRFGEEGNERCFPVFDMVQNYLVKRLGVDPCRIVCFTGDSPENFQLPIAPSRYLGKPAPLREIRSAIHDALTQARDNSP